MARRLLSLALLALAACDGTAPAPEPPPPDPGGPPLAERIAGTWAVSRVTTEFEVVSDVAQTLPDLQAEGEGGIVVEGDLSARLTHAVDPFWFVFKNALRPEWDLIGFQTIPGGHFRDVETEPGTRLILTSTESSLGVTLTVRDETGHTSSAGREDPEPRPTHTRDGGRITIETQQVTSVDGTIEASASGSVTFPTIQLAPNEPTVVRSFDAGIEAGSYTFTFGDDGTYFADFSATGQGEHVGTWAEEADGQIVVRVLAPSPGWTEHYAVEHAGDRLTLVSRRPPVGCGATCSARYERGLLAEPGSLRSPTYVSVIEFDPAPDTER